MNTKHIQTFLMVSTAFFAMSAPMRPQAANALGNGATRTTAAASTTTAVSRQRESQENEGRG